MVPLLEDIVPAYNKYFIYLDIHGIKCMYAYSKKAVYSTLEALLLFSEKLSKILLKWATIEINMIGVWWTKIQS